MFTMLSCGTWKCCPSSFSGKFKIGDDGLLRAVDNYCMCFIHVHFHFCCLTLLMLPDNACGIPACRLLLPPAVADSLLHVLRCGAMRPGAGDEEGVRDSVGRHW